MTGTSSYVGEEIDQTSFDGRAVTVAESEPLKLEIETLCPFCGTFNSGIGKPCMKCKVEDTTSTRAATVRKSGPWSVLRAQGADAQEMGFEDLQRMIRNRELTSRSVVRGPTTGNLWRLASKVRGLSREFGQCYYCSGDIETDETICPHCDRTQTTPQQDQPIAKAIAAPAVTPANHSQVRQALLNDPVIHVHSLSHPDHAPVDPVMAARPVVAERSERHIPKDDLLTPRDLAKAFQLEFGLQQEQLDRHLGRPNHTIRKIKIGLTSAAALGLSGLLLWPVTHVVSSWINATPTRTSRPVASSVTFADARSANNASLVSPYENEFPTPPVRPSYAPVSHPIVASAMLTPAPVSEPDPTLSPEDDPRLLWARALEAESGGHYHAAVGAYERIESLPSGLWPANLETRLALARKELQGDVR